MLLEWRLDSLLEKFNIDLLGPRDIIWPCLSKQLVTYKYITDEELVAIYGYWVIKKIIWKGIINYDFISGINELHTKMLYNNYYDTRRIFTKFPPIEPKYVFNKTFSESKENMNNMWDTIITYFILINIISADLILDMRNEIKKCLYHVVFQLE